MVHGHKQRLRLGVRLPTVCRDVVQLMAELIGKLHPGSLASVDNDPGHAVAVQTAGGPDVCLSTRILVG